MVGAGSRCNGGTAGEGVKATDGIKKERRQ